MIVLLYMLERGKTHWTEPVTPNEMARFFHTYLMEKEYRRLIDFAEKDHRKLWDWNDVAEAKIIQLFDNMPMTKWSWTKGSMTYFKEGDILAGLRY
ncbi:hypothetical protein [Paenibacillus crassostreae]|uniref:Uncharacterized protein n=1 Tax=Paenibacillus crassostreae TaxID=1763538 RepID=A0A162N7V8_9BACL|nr:hypothetical protein [Paenibacillus crassostreae]AOZ93767.1 hypothetical protein LPB68_17270 [Paenibacillus crassostreae]OAB71302.1 hypothetical protein PNBC_20140 [Paenibacillus crassostreae]